ncbi:MAG: hypothetical protein COB36_13125 [Alphaproteobacteria bacterium]|nr:MAG: hypothetical protein COB36_13125 [Alphaproteobacteria bacterium]
MRKPVKKPKVLLPPRRLVSADECSALLLPSFADDGRLASALDKYEIPIFIVEPLDSPSWTNEKLIEVLSDQYIRQVIVFGDLSDPELVATCLLSIQSGYDVFAIISHPDLRNPNNLLSWMRLRDYSVKTLSIKLLLAELALVATAPVAAE